VGIILRNLPPDCTADMLRKNFQSNPAASFRIMSADHPMNFKGQRCAIIRVEDYE
jgi:hypothetical protein